MWARRDEFRTDLTELFRLLKAEEIKPVIAARIPLASARQADELLADGGIMGEIVLLCGQDA